MAGWIQTETKTECLQFIDFRLIQTNPANQQLQPVVTLEWIAQLLLEFSCCLIRKFHCAKTFISGIKPEFSSNGNPSRLKPNSILIQISPNWIGSILIKNYCYNNYFRLQFSFISIWMLHSNQTNKSNFFDLIGIDLMTAFSDWMN